MNLRYFILLFVSIMISSCYNYSYFKEYQINSSEKPLPKLLPISSNTYLDGRFIGANPHQNYSLEYKSKNQQIVFDQFSKHIALNLSEHAGLPYGYAVLHIDYLNQQKKYSILNIFNSMLIGIPSLVGVPINQQVLELEISVEIVDSKENTLAIYNSKSQKKAMVALYYGYSYAGASQKILYESIESCLNEISLKIAEDEAKLRKQLLNTGILSIE